MSLELPPFLPTDARARARAFAPRSRRVASRRCTDPRFAFAAPAYAMRGALMLFSIGTLLLAWYAIGKDQQQQQVNREQSARIRSIAPGP